ncbi:MAG: FHA domain-containing protein [Planctomycetaceae bacterium]|nr:FHA domain-containing protein [Planctomycetaceae bacterium]
MEASILIVQGADQGNRFPLDVPQLVLGRSTKCDIRVNDSEASRQHARLVQSGESWSIVDLNSSNGTYVNGLAVRQQELQQGDQIQVGRTILLFDPGTSSLVEGAPPRIQLVADSSQDHSHIVGRVARDSVTQFGGDNTANIAGGLQAGASLNALYRITEEIVRPMASLDQSLQNILDLTLTAVGAERGCMLVTNSKTDVIEPRVISHTTQSGDSERMPISTSIVEYVIENGRGVRTSDASHDSRFDGGRSILQSGIREAMCVPMQGRYELMGVVYVDITTKMNPSRSKNSERLNDALLNLLQAIGRQTALFIENNRYQQALVEAERLGAMGQTIATMSHHIKNILQGVRGGGYLVDNGLHQHDEKTIKQGWGIVERNLDRIYNLVMDMLQFSKERQPEPRSTNLNVLILEVCELMAARCEEFGLSIDFELLQDMPNSLFDPDGLHRALLNVLTNAIDAVDGEESPRVIVRSGIDHASETVWVEVEDNGPGIPEEELPKMFHLFESTKGSRGTGLGLPVSRKILTEHGGDISAENVSTGGARFRMHWPFVPDDETHSIESNTLNLGDGLPPVSD